MIPDEIQRTIDFILQHQANAARMDETDKHLRDLSESTSRQIRELAISTQQFHDDVKGFIKVLTPVLEIQSKRLDRLEGHP